MSKTIKLNPGFICQNCGFNTPPAQQTCRNHCMKCLYSLHVDAAIPGDRASDCLGLMEAIQIDQNGKKGFMIIHRCLKCGKKIPNKAAEDDSTDSLIKIIHRQNLGYQ